MKKTGIWIEVLTLLLLAAHVSATTATNLVVDYDLTGVDVDLRPGDSGILTLVIKNTGGYAADDVSVWIPDIGEVRASKRWYVGSIESGISKTLSTTVNVDKNASIGLKTLQARITYDGQKSDGTQENDKSITWDIPIRVYGKANFQFSTADVEYTQDSIAELRITARPKINVRELTSTLSSSCISIVGSSRQYIGDMIANRDYDIVYQIKPSQAGICTLVENVEYYDSSGTQTTENTSIGLNVMRASTELKVIDIVDGELALGSVSDITIRIKNLGNTKASDVTATLNLSSPFTPVKSSQKHIGDIEPEATVDALFSISVDSTGQKKSYSIPLTLEYYDEAGVKETTSVNIGLGVGGNADININLDEKDSLIPGSSGKVTIGVVNRGFVDAKFLTLQLVGTDEYEVSSADSAYIGALNSDDSDSQDYTVRVYKNVTGKEIMLKTRVEYKEENNDQLIVKEQLIKAGLTSSEDYAKQNGGSGVISLVIGLVALIVVLIALYLGVWFLTRALGAVTSKLDKKIFRRDEEE
jgi:hypothetical protein